MMYMYWKVSCFIYPLKRWRNNRYSCISNNCVKFLKIIGSHIFHPKNKSFLNLPDFDCMQVFHTLYVQRNLLALWHAKLNFHVELYIQIQLIKWPGMYGTVYFRLWSFERCFLMERALSLPSSTCCPTFQRSFETQKNHWLKVRSNLTC